VRAPAPMEKRRRMGSTRRDGEKCGFHSQGLGRGEKTDSCGWREGKSNGQELVSSGVGGKKPERTKSLMLRIGNRLKNWGEKGLLWEKKLRGGIGPVQRHSPGERGGVGRVR